MNVHRRNMKIPLIMTNENNVAEGVVMMKWPMYSIVFFLFSLIVITAGAEPVDHWGLKTASPAQVNTVTASPLQEIISLSGEWDFVTDPRLMGRHRMGKGPGWNEPDWKNTRKIEVPGCWAAQGVGKPRMSQEWDLPFDCIPRPLKHVYMGTARYRRNIEIPKDWAGKRVWLKIGGVRTEAWFWVNQQRVGHINTYCGAYKYDITDLVKPGETAEIIATVRNDTPSRKGIMAAFHRFGGFYRDIELEATPETRIEDVWGRGDLEQKLAEVHVSLQQAGDAVVHDLKVKIDINTLDGIAAGTFSESVKLDKDGSVDMICRVPLSEFHLWTPETPNLYLATVTLLSGSTPIHGWTERFGLRKLEVRGDQFFLNGKPFFMRGYGDDYIYPLTLISPPDREDHIKRLRIAKEAGFNYVRLHTHCESPEFFEAADEVGMLIQPELPYYHDITTEGFEFDPLRDMKELYRHFRRYVSFASYSTGNEGHLGSPIDQEVYQWAKRTDPDRIMQHQDGGCNTKENSDYYSPNGYGIGSSIKPWPVGRFAELDVPFIAHEYLNLSIKMDPRTAPKFTGAIPAPRSLEDYEASLEAAGLTRYWGDACLDAAHGLQGYYQKQGLEQARIDPACDGYSYWTLVDVMVQQGGTYTGQGFLNAFWEEKQGGLTIEQFRQFNGPTALLATFTPESMIAVSGDRCAVDLWISHFETAPLKQAKVIWTLSAGGQLLDSGAITPFDANSGDVKTLGRCDFTVPELDTPTEAQFEVTLEGAGLANTWDLWFFPKRTSGMGTGIAVTEDLYDVLSKRYPDAVKAGTSEAANARLVIGSWDHPDLVAANQNNTPGIMIGPAEGSPNIKLGWWSLGNQLGTAFANHPAFGDFPHNGNISPLWFRLIKQGHPLPIDPQYGEQEFLAVGEGKNQYFAYIWQKKQEDKADLLITRGIDLLPDTPEGACMLDAMIAYVQSDAFTAD
jgi:beta-galactosidase